MDNDNENENINNIEEDDDAWMDEEDDSEDFDELSEDQKPTAKDFEVNGQYYVLNYLKDYVDPNPSQEKLIAIMDAYRNGTEEERDEALKQMYGILCCYIWNYLNKFFKSYMPQHSEDLFQQALLGVMDGMVNYDPVRARPTTWFKRTIHHQILVYLNEFVDHSTAHYSVAEKKLVAVIKRKELAGVEYTDRDLYIETGIPIKTIQSVMQHRNIAVSSISAAGEDFDPVSKNTLSPEREYLNDEQLRTLHAAIFGDENHVSNLTDTEQKVLCYKFGLFGADTLNNKKISDLLNIQSGKVDLIYREASRKLKRNLSKDKPKSKKPIANKPSVSKVCGVMLSDKEMSEDMSMLLLGDDEEYIVN